MTKNWKIVNYVNINEMILSFLELLWKRRHETTEDLYQVQIIR